MKRSWASSSNDRMSNPHRLPGCRTPNPAAEKALGGRARSGVAVRSQSPTAPLPGPACGWLHRERHNRTFAVGVAVEMPGYAQALHGRVVLPKPLGRFCHPEVLPPPGHRQERRPSADVPERRRVRIYAAAVGCCRVACSR
nr:hypothetical protein [Escherichia coli]